jgi:hypothetical protein
VREVGIAERRRVGKLLKIQRPTTVWGYFFEKELDAFDVGLHGFLTKGVLH